MSDTDLRSLVKDVLHEVLAARGRPASQSEMKPEAVRIASDSDLAAFAQRIVKLLENPATAEAIRSARYRFTLANAAPATLRTSGSETVLLEGAVTEAKINRCAKNSMILLAPDAVLTPLARDRARVLGLKIERKR